MAPIATLVVMIREETLVVVIREETLVVVIRGDSGSGDSGGDSGSDDSDTTCNDEEGGYICPQPDESPPDNLGNGQSTNDEPSTNDTNGDNPSTKDDTSSDNKQITENGNGTDNIQPSIPAICNNETGCDDTCPDGNNCDEGAPIADAGPDREISEGESLSIDGSQSNDPNGDDLQYHWEVDNSLISGSQDGSQLDIKGPEVQEDAYYTVTLKVTDKDGNSDSDHMSLKVIDTSGPNPEPIPCEENGNMTGPDCPSPPCEYGNMTGPDCPVPNPEPIPCEENGNMTGNGTGCVPNPVP